MSLNQINRTIHSWAGIVVALPLFVIAVTGVFLQAKKHWAWVQPPEQRGTVMNPAITLDMMWSAVRHARPGDARDWKDVSRVDLRPNRGLAKFSLKSGWEVQVDLGTGAVLQSAYRRSDVIESIHDGSFFGGDAVKLGVFLPVGVALLILLAGGLWMWWLPIAVRRRRAAGRRTA